MACREGLGYAQIDRNQEVEQLVTLVYFIYVFSLFTMDYAGKAKSVFLCRTLQLCVFLAVCSLRL